ncbi:hypothetical protein BLA60_05440 [Actinophytocola xinjiangensis]|uniref:Uncharacterized protein n=1 Tax=Actinophytocola xinjiangensis TaxID=485602 RepID=A0A7Z0WPY9_9PSEU|nr:DUF5980 family protein [Actinophytocola xinjiangensis]OLF12723.1 hypothetical protein BLA60_05440 [Actinophytocola xinjiangensis]
MRSIRRGVRLTLGMLAAALLVLTSTAPASAATATATTTATWTLEDYGQGICLQPGGGHPSAYVLAPVTGTWTTTITTGIRNFPPGTTSTGGTTFPPGSHDGSYINGYVQVSIAPAPEGDHIGEVWATDGTETQTVPVLLRYSYETNCWA